MYGDIHYANIPPMKKRTEETNFLSEEIGKKLKNTRKKLQLTQKQLSERIHGGMDYTYIGKIERGDIMPSIKMLKRISEGLQIPVDFFFQKETVVDLLGLLPQDIRDIAQDIDKVAFFREVKQLDKEDVPLVTEIIRILNKHRASFRESKVHNYLPSTKHAIGLVAEKKSHYKRRVKKSDK